MDTRKYWTVVALVKNSRPLYCYLCVQAYSPEEAVLHAEGLCNDELPAGGDKVIFVAAVVFKGAHTVVKPDVSATKQFKQLVAFNPATRRVQLFSYEELDDIKEELPFMIPFGLVPKELRPEFCYNPQACEAPDTFDARRSGAVQLFPALARLLREQNGSGDEA